MYYNFIFNLVPHPRTILALAVPTRCVVTMMEDEIQHRITLQPISFVRLKLRGGVPRFSTRLGDQRCD